MKFEIKEKTIDIGLMLAQLKPGLYRFLPGFFVYCLRRLFHENASNAYFQALKEKQGVDFADATMSYFGYSHTLHGAENFDPSTRSIICSNHPLGGMDGMALISAIGGISKEIVFPVSDILLSIPNMRTIFSPVRKIGLHSNNNLAVKDAFHSEKTVLYFPAGLCSRKQKDGRIEDPPWKKTFVNQALRTQRNIIPCYIEAKNSKFFYNFANLRQKLGIKVNLEQFLLIDEVFKQKNKHLNIYLGKPIPWKSLDSSKSPQEWANKIKELAYQIPRV